MSLPHWFAKMPQPQLPAQAQPLQLTPQPETPAQPSPCVSEQVSYKNRLQEFTQRAAIPLPTYQTYNEGSPHAPMFRSTVFVDGTAYTSPSTFSHRKTAEQDVSRIALLSAPQKIKGEAYPVIQQDSTFCKFFLNEYAAKIHAEPPTYTTEDKSEGIIPFYVSTVVFNGKQYVGDRGRNKKEAQQFAARAAMLSIFDSESGTVIAEMIKSKKLFAAMDKLKEDSRKTQNDVIPVAIQRENNLPIDDSAAVNLNMPITAIPEPSSGVLTNISAMGAHLLEFRPPKEANPADISGTPIMSVPPSSEQPAVASTSGVKRRRRCKKAKKKAKVDDAQLQVPVLSLSQPSSCSVAQ